MGATALIRRTSAVSSVGTSWAAFASDGSWDLVVPATAGDILELGVSSLWNSGALYSNMDMGTIVSGSVVNWVSTGSGSHTTGVLSWFVPNNNEYMDVSGTTLYTVQSGDISGGNVTFRLYGKVASSTRTLDTPGILWAAKCDNTPVSSSLTGTLSSSWAVLTGSVTIAASAGDVIACTLNGILDPGTGNTVGRFDAATMVSGSAVNWLSNGTSTRATDGVSGWYCTQGNYEPLGGSVLYTVQSGDISGGNVTVRIWGIGITTANRPLDAGSKFYVRKV